ncbi:potassium channel family protein [Streptomyces sp. Je 1-369]|uniref:potassium channel family protein n=1 Tax=Streptomyces sp. Je 1-369 TaxID=2966192 RepID=UPI002285C600|nr:NAD(P)-binding protein [Streptomyces sp. Je 1-369]WAM00489.1 NAD-binding protein [Streptomyces sp. Je 1-369]
MVVCGGDNVLAHRLAAELRGVYGEQVVLVLPSGGAEPSRLTGRARTTALIGRITAAVSRTTGNGNGSAHVNGNGNGNGNGTGEGGGAADLPRTLEAPELTDDVLVDAGVPRAAALALMHDDDETNIRTALAARRLNPRLRLVIRLYNRKLGQHVEELLDQAAAVAGLATTDASVTVLSDADTAAPALAATAVAGTSKVVHADGLLLRAVERTPPAPGQVAPRGLATLALLSSTANDPAGAEGSDDAGAGAGPRLLPDDAAVAAAPGRGALVLETVSYSGTAPPPGFLAGRGVPLRELFSRRLRWSVAGFAAAVVGMAIASIVTTEDTTPLHATYLTLLDLFSINDPATDGPMSRQVLQLLAGLVGLLLLPILFAAVLEALGTFRTASSLRRPPRGLSGHVVLLGLGKIGTRVLARLRELDIPVVCVEADPEARGISLARRLRVPTVIGDVTEEGVLEAAKVHRAHALLALTSADTINLEAALYARSVKPDLRVALRLYDDEFATAVYRTLRAAHPGALTRSRSVSALAAPAFAGAMMGRQILGALPVERSVLLFAALDVSLQPQLTGRRIAEVFRPGAWRVVALERASHQDPNLPSGLEWELDPSYELRPEDRVVLAATRQGLAELLARRPLPAQP